MKRGIGKDTDLKLFGVRSLFLATHTLFLFGYNTIWLQFPIWLQPHKLLNVTDSEEIK